MSLWFQSYCGYSGVENQILDEDSESRRAEKVEHILGHISMDILLSMSEEVSLGILTQAATELRKIPRLERLVGMNALRILPILGVSRSEKSGQSLLHEANRLANLGVNISMRRDQSAGDREFLKGTGSTSGLLETGRNQSGRSSSSEFVDDHFRVWEHGLINLFQVATISWQGPAQPRIKWRTLLATRDQVGESELNTLCNVFQYDARYFNVCRVCHSREMVGRFIDGDICHSCAERTIP